MANAVQTLHEIASRSKRPSPHFTCMEGREDGRTHFTFQCDWEGLTVVGATKESKKSAKQSAAAELLARSVRESKVAL